MMMNEKDLTGFKKGLKSRPTIDGLAWGTIKTDDKGFISVDDSTTVIAGKPQAAIHHIRNIFFQV